MWDVLSRVAKMALDVMSGVIKTAWDVMSGMTKTAWDVLSGVANLSRVSKNGMGCIVAGCFVRFPVTCWERADLLALVCGVYM